MKCGELGSAELLIKLAFWHLNKNYNFRTKSWSSTGCWPVGHVVQGQTVVSCCHLSHQHHCRSSHCFSLKGTAFFFVGLPYHDPTRYFLASCSWWIVWGGIWSFGWPNALNQTCTKLAAFLDPSWFRETKTPQIRPDHTVITSQNRYFWVPNNDTIAHKIPFNLQPVQAMWPFANYFIHPLNMLTKNIPILWLESLHTF